MRLFKDSPADRYVRNGLTDGSCSYISKVEMRSDSTYLSASHSIVCLNVGELVFDADK